MKKKILGIAILAITGLSMTAVAQKPCKQACNATECTDSASCDRAPRGPHAFNPFEGIELTQEQKNKFETLKKNKAEQFKKEQKDRMTRKRDERREYLNDIKSILTPEQYVQFLENSYLNPAPMGDKMMRDNHQRGKKGMHKMNGRPGKDIKKKNDGSKNKPTEKKEKK